MALLSFLHIGKANSRITELEAQVATLTKERDDAVSALESNASEVSDSAEKLQTDLELANARISELTNQRDIAVDSIAADAKKIADLQAKLDAKDKEVEVKVSQKAATIQAALGQPAAPVIPEGATRTATAQAKEKPLFGLDRVIAAFKAETAARNAKQ